MKEIEYSKRQIKVRCNLKLGFWGFCADKLTEDFFVGRKLEMFFKPLEDIN